MIYKQSSRILHHRLSTTASFTVPLSEDPATWVPTDLGNGEYGINIPTQKVFMRIGSSIVPINGNGFTGSVNFSLTQSNVFVVEVAATTSNNTLTVSETETIMNNVNGLTSSTVTIAYDNVDITTPSLTWNGSPIGTGTIGATGPMGPAGATGAPGVTGSIGPIGPTGPSAVVISTTYSTFITAISGSTLTPGSVYNLTDKRIQVTALSSNTVSRNGTRQMYLPYTYVAGQFVGFTWLGMWRAALTPSAGHLAIWGGKVWQNLTGAVGTIVNDATLDATNWVAIALGTAPYYFDKSFSIIYDYVNDWVSKQMDEKGNEVGILYTAGISNPCDLTDWGYNTYELSDNKCPFGIYNNKTTGQITNNRCLSIYRNNSVGTIVGNITNSSIYLNTNTGSINYNTNNGSIYSNSCLTISDNKNNGSIYSNANSNVIQRNSNNGAIGLNTNTGAITDNSNNGTISGNDAITGAVGAIQHNSNNGNINTNFNTGVITYNSNGGVISDNSHNGLISGNKNNGDIYLCTGVTSHNIVSNINNGYISGSHASTVTDTVVNK